MNKRGQIAEIFGVVFMVGLFVFGAISSTTILSENRYAGDSSTNTSYDLSKCIVKIPNENLVYFKNLEEAENNGFRMAECN